LEKSVLFTKAFLLYGVVLQESAFLDIGWIASFLSNARHVGVSFQRKDHRRTNFMDLLRKLPAHNLLIGKHKLPTNLAQ